MFPLNSGPTRAKAVWWAWPVLAAIRRPVISAFSQATRGWLHGSTVNVHKHCACIVYSKTVFQPRSQSYVQRPSAFECPRGSVKVLRTFKRCMNDYTRARRRVERWREEVPKLKSQNELNMTEKSLTWIEDSWLLFRSPWWSRGRSPWLVPSVQHLLKHHR